MGNHLQCGIYTVHQRLTLSLQQRRIAFYNLRGVAAGCLPLQRQRQRQRDGEGVDRRRRVEDEGELVCRRWRDVAGCGRRHIVIDLWAVG